MEIQELNIPQVDTIENYVEKVVEEIGKIDDKVSSSGYSKMKYIYEMAQYAITNFSIMRRKTIFKKIQNLTLDRGVYSTYNMFFNAWEYIERVKDEENGKYLLLFDNAREFLVPHTSVVQLSNSKLLFKEKNEILDTVLVGKEDVRTGKRVPFSHKEVVEFIKLKQGKTDDKSFIEKTTLWNDRENMFKNFLYHFLEDPININVLCVFPLSDDDKAFCNTRKINVTILKEEELKLSLESKHFVKNTDGEMFDNNYFNAVWIDMPWYLDIDKRPGDISTFTEDEYRGLMEMFSAECSNVVTEGGIVGVATSDQGYTPENYFPKRDITHEEIVKHLQKVRNICVKLKGEKSIIEDLKTAHLDIQVYQKV